MRSFLLVILLLIKVLSGLEVSGYRIIDTRSGKEVEFSELAADLLEEQVIFFGEYHENKLLHDLEIELLRELYTLDHDLAVSMEMFERDVQVTLDEFLNGEISEEEFLQRSRPWSNYEADYRPIIEFCREKGLEIIAANIPRIYASRINKKGLNALDSLSIDEKRFVAKEHLVLDDEYKIRFITTMKQNMAHNPNMPMGMTMNFELIYAAQCIKDDTMAESILEYHESNPGKIIIHFNGDFHSRKHLGTAQKLELLKPDLNITVISPLIVDDDYGYMKEELLEGDYLILIRDFVEE